MEVIEMKNNSASVNQEQCITGLSRRDDDEEKNNSMDVSSDIEYKLDDVPPWYLCAILGLQHYLTMFGGTVTYPYLIAPKLCIRDHDPARGYLISTTFFISGICTFLQTTFGTRLPIVQGSTMAFLVPILSILNLPEWQCPEYGSGSNYTLSDKEWDDIWMVRMREVQGAIIGASLFEVLLGFTGLIGFLLNWITPLAIAPTISLIGLSLFAEAANAASTHWGIAWITISLLILFSQCLKNITFPRITCNRKKESSSKQFPIFKLFPVLLTILSSWSLCAVLTTTNVFQNENPARTDLRLDTLKNSPWFRFPYPGQWGVPTFSVAAIFGVLAGVLASSIESIGDYYACAKLSGAKAPPKHAVNRGIWIEGIGCVLAGLWGSGSGVTSYSENIGAIGITKVASRRVIQFGSAIMIVFGMLGKLGALFVTIPEPIIGGVFCVMFSMITAVGLSSLQYVELNSSRNLFVLGFSIFMGLCIPKWMQSNPGVISTGYPALDQVLLVLSSTGMFVGGALGFLLDNIIPGTAEERGIIKWKKHISDGNNSEASSSTASYDIPLFPNAFRKLSLFKLFPVSPTYDENIMRNAIAGIRNKTIRNGQTPSSVA